MVSFPTRNNVLSRKGHTADIGDVVIGSVEENCILHQVTGNSEAVNFTAQLCIKNISADGIGLNARTKYRNGFHQFYLYVGSQ
jgi:hypothetical protein